MAADPAVAHGGMIDSGLRTALTVITNEMRAFMNGRSKTFVVSRVSDSNMYF